MTKWTKIMCCVAVPLALLFAWVGYAKLTATLTIQGNAQAEMPNAVYIAEIKEIVYSNAEAVPYGEESGDPVAVDFPSTHFLCNTKFNGRGAKVSFEVTVVNGTSIARLFNKIKIYDSADGGSAYDYDGISGNNNPSASIAQGFSLAPKSSVTFTVTISYSQWSRDTNKMLFDIEFVRDSTQFTQAASQAVLTRFEEIINNPSEYQQLFGTGQGNSHGLASNGGDSGYYISNNAASPPDAKNLVNSLFAGTLTLVFEDEEIPITVLLKDGNMCTWNDPGWGRVTNERALYMTADTLDRQGQQAPVFVVVYHQQDDGKWVPVCEEGVMLEGTATIIAHDGSAGTGNFQTDEWVSTKAYRNAGVGSNLTRIMNEYRP